MPKITTDTRTGILAAARVPLRLFGGKKMAVEVHGALLRLIVTRPRAVDKRERKIFEVFRNLINEGVQAGEFFPVNCDDSATALEDGTGVFLHPLMIPAIVNEIADTRARHVVGYLPAGFGRPKC
jgi:hypothetical protein